MKANWSIVSKYRNELFGIATVLVMLTHSTSYVWNGAAGKILLKIFNQGSMGVDIFLFLSGMGLYYSLKKDDNIKNFYLKRARRILIPYAVLAVPGFIILDLLLKKVTIKKFLIDALTLSFWVQGDAIIWYISFIAFLYLIYPVIYFFLLEKKNSNLYFVCALLASLLFNIWLLGFMPELYDRFVIAVTRFPVFIAGCWGGKWAYKKKDVCMWIPVSAFMIFLVMKVVLIFYRGIIPDRIDWLVTYESFFMGALAIIFLVPVILERIDNKYINESLKWIGSLSLEIYLIHWFLRCIHLSMPTGRQYKSAWIYFMIIIPAALLIAKACEMIRGRIKVIDKEKPDGKVKR